MLRQVLRPAARAARGGARAAHTAALTADAVVVGAGIIGASTALQLARKGLRVAVVDKNPYAGSGSTAYSSGIWWAAISSRCLWVNSAADESRRPQPHVLLGHRQRQAVVRGPLLLQGLGQRHWRA
jgi:glycine/D-amino acid oxidase-like deaminating enzyme